MTLDDVRLHFDAVWAKLQALRQAGQKEYAGGENAFGNFERLAAKLQLPREKVLWVYLTKHLDGIEAWLNGHKSQREPVTGRIEDAIVYLLLLHAMASEERLPVAQPAACVQDLQREKLGRWAAWAVDVPLSVDLEAPAQWDGETLNATREERFKALQVAYAVKRAAQSEEA